MSRSRQARAAPLADGVGGSGDAVTPIRGDAGSDEGAGCVGQDDVTPRTSVNAFQQLPGEVGHDLGIVGGKFAGVHTG